jgi:hypothetical protein
MLGCRVLVRVQPFDPDIFVIQHLEPLRLTDLEIVTYPLPFIQDLPNNALLSAQRRGAGTCFMLLNNSGDVLLNEPALALGVLHGKLPLTTIIHVFTVLKVHIPDTLSRGVGLFNNKLYLECLSKCLLEVVEADERAPQREKRLMDIRPPLIPDGQPPVAVQPRQGPFDDPAVPTQLLAGVDPLAGNPDLDPAPGQRCPAARQVICLVGV